MRHLFGDRSRLLFRSYLYLVAGLLIVATVLDLGFAYLQSSEEPKVNRWLENTFHLIERDLAVVPEHQRHATALALSESIGTNVQVLARDDVVTIGTTEQHMTALVDADGSTSYLYDAAGIDAILRLGPVAEQRESLLLKMLPPLFYLSIFVVVGLWLRPLLRDINLITDGAQQFAADYREPLATAEQTTELSGLAKNIDNMSARISGLLRSQKELIAALSHEMRTPLARIRFALAVIGDNERSNLKEQVGALDNDVQEIDDLIASMLNYARLDHPDVRMHWQEVPLGPWLDLIVSKSQTDNITISSAGNAGPKAAWMDPRLMELALSNLLVNACRYAEKEVRCTLTKNADGYVLAVEDDGRGIPIAERNKIFKAFTRIDDSRNRDTGGYGLGLAIVARIAELHGGEATVDSSEQLSGARFQIRWRVRQTSKP